MTVGRLVPASFTKLAQLSALIALATFQLVSSSAPVRAQAAEASDDAEDVDSARSHFKAGVDYYRDGDLSAALIEFKRAYAAAPNYRILYNLGSVSHEMRDYTEAKRYFDRYLLEGAGEIEPARKQEVELALAKIASRIASVVLSSNVEGAEYFVDDVSVGKGPFSEPVRVSAGRRRISAAANGRARVTQVIDASGGDTLVVQLVFAPASAGVAAPHPVAANAQTQPEDSAISPAVWLGIGSGALAIGAGVLAIMASSDAGSYNDALERKTSASELNSLKDGAQTKALVSDILLGTALAGAVVTVVVAMTSGDGPTERASASKARAPSAQLSLGAGSVSLSGRFQ